MSSVCCIYDMPLCPLNIASSCQNTNDISKSFTWLIFQQTRHVKPTFVKQCDNVGRVKSYNLKKYASLQQCREVETNEKTIIVFKNLIIYVYI